MHSRLIFTLLFLATSIFNSFSQKPPDISGYAKEVFEIFKKKDIAKFESKVLYNEKELSKYFDDLAVNDPVFSEKIKKGTDFTLEDVKEKIKSHIERQRKGFKEFLETEEYKKIDWAKAKYEDTYYQIERNQNESFIVEAKMYIRFSSNEHYYIITLKDVVSYNGKWAGARITDLDEVNFANKPIQEDYNDIGDIAITDEVPAVDTVKYAYDELPPDTDNYFSYLLEGTIGNSPIVMLMQGTKEAKYCSYFYKKYKKDIIIYSPVGEDPSILKSTDGSEIFKLEKNENGWIGTWESGEKILNVTLKPVELEKVKHNYLAYNAEELSDPIRAYSYMRTSDIELKEISEEVVDKKYKIKWYADPVKNIKGFRVAEGLPKDKMDFINGHLTIDHFKNIENAYTILSGENDDNYSLNTVFITDHIFSASFKTKLIIEGETAYYIKAINLNLDQHTEVYRDEFLEFPYVGEKEETVAAKANEYLLNSVGKSLIKILKKLYPEKMNQEGCEYTNPESWIYGTCFFTSKGLYVGATYPTPVNCMNPSWSIIPYKELKIYYQPNSGLVLPE